MTNNAPELEPCRLCNHTPDSFFGIEEASAICLGCGYEMKVWDEGPNDPKHELIKRWNALNDRADLAVTVKPLVWQPIETAPKDVEVLAWSKKWNVPYLIKATLKCHGWAAGGFDLSNSNQPTHWAHFTTPDEDLTPTNHQAEIAPFADRVHDWMLECFTVEIAADSVERNHRFLEEALELVQSLDCPKEDALALVNYVYSRPVGEPVQETGGVMVTLAALCNAANINMIDAAETELARVWTKVEKIRAKQATKPRGSALPQEWSAPDGATAVLQAREDAAFQEGVEAVRKIAVSIARNGFKSEREGAKAVLEEIRELKREVK